MSGAFALLMRVFVQRYYFLNAGFFLVVFLLLFGVIDPAASIRLHYDLMVLMASKPALLAGAIGIMLVYLIKCVRFTLQQPGLPEHGILYELQALKPGRLRSYLLAVILSVYAPALIYFAILTGVSLQHGLWSVIAITVSTQALLVSVCVSMLQHRLMQRMTESRVDKMLRRLEAFRPDYLRFGQFFTAFLLSRKKLMLLLLKTASLLMLQLMVYINRDEPERAGTFYVLLFLIVAHALIPWQLRQFGEGQPWLRNLPISTMRRYAAFAGTYALLFLPEVIFLLLHVRSSLTYADMLSFYALATSMLCGMHAMLYLPGVNMDKYLLIMFLLYPLSIIALAIVSPWAMAAFWIAVSVTIFSLRYHRAEIEVE